MKPEKSSVAKNATVELSSNPCQLNIEIVSLFNRLYFNLSVANGHTMGFAAHNLIERAMIDVAKLEKLMQPNAEFRNAASGDPGLDGGVQ